MPLQKLQNTQVSALPRRNISNTSASSSASFKQVPASKIARLSPTEKTALTGISSSMASRIARFSPTEKTALNSTSSSMASKTARFSSARSTTLNGTSDSEASETTRLSSTRNTTLNGTSNSEVGNAEPKLASNSTKSKDTIQRNLKLVSAMLAPAKAQKTSAADMQMPKVDTFNSIKSIASKISRITPSRKSESNGSTPCVPSDSLNHETTRIPTPVAPQKSKADHPTVSYLSGPLAFDATKSQNNRKVPHIPIPAAPQKAKADHPTASYLSSPLAFDTFKPQVAVSEKTDASQSNNNDTLYMASTSVDVQKPEQGIHTEEALRILSVPLWTQKTSNVASTSADAQTPEQGSDTKDTIRIVSEPIEAQKVEPSILYTAQIDTRNALDKTSVGVSHANNAIHTYLESSEMQNSISIPEIVLTEPLEVLTATKEHGHRVANVARVKFFNVDSPSSFKSIDPALFDITPIKISHLTRENAATLSDSYPTSIGSIDPALFHITPIKISDLCRENIYSLPDSHPTSVGSIDPALFEITPISISDLARAKVTGLSDDDATSTMNNDPALFETTPINVNNTDKEKVAGLPNSEQADAIRPSIEQDDHERRHIFSTHDWLNQKRRQFSSAQTPCPGDGADEHKSSDDHGRTFPSIRKFASKMARIMPANRRERGGTFRFGTPVVRNSSQLELFNTINEYVVESEKERDDNLRRSDELANAAEQLLVLGEKEREVWLSRERALKCRIEELEKEVAGLQARVVIAEKGEDHLGVQGANPFTGVWSDLEEVGEGRGEGKEGKGKKGRGRWRRLETSWAFGPSESSSTGTIIRTRPDNPEPTQPSSIGSIIRNIHIHHHHHWSVARARRSS